MGYHAPDGAATVPGGLLGCRLLRLVRAIKRDSASRSYTDLALTAVDDEVSLDLLTKTTGVQAAMAHAKKVAELTGHAAA